MQAMTAFLWMDGTAEAAAAFYVALFPDTRIDAVRRFTASGHGVEGTVMSVELTLLGRPVVLLNGGPYYALTPAASWWLPCPDQATLERYWAALGDGGEPMACGWVTDRFGVTWQVVPDVLDALLYGPHGDAVMAQVLTMDRLDRAPILRAAGRA